MPRRLGASAYSCSKSRALSKLPSGEISVSRPNFSATMSLSKAPQTAVPNGHTKLREVTYDTPLDDVFDYWHEDGAIILKGLLNPSQVTSLVSEIAILLEKIKTGSTSEE